MRLATFIISFAGWLLSGFVFMKVWEWFVSTVFNIPEINYAQALGLLLVLTFFKSKNRAPEESDSKQDLLFSVSIVIFNFMVLGLGALIHTFV